jgi:putative tryptophan/tyrosine transport system substrate-binding protein
MRRRDLLALIGGAAALWPLPGSAQRAALPVVGLLDLRTPETIVDRLRAFRLGLKEAGYVEGENVTLVYRWAEGKADRVPSLVTDLVRRKVDVIATAGDSVPAVVKAATTTIPIVSITSQDPVGLGLVASLACPGGNLTGINFVGGELTGKRLQLLHEMVPAAARVAVLINPTNASSAEATLRDVEDAARSLGLQFQVVNATTSHEIDAAFTVLTHDSPAALFVGSDAFYTSRRVQLVNLAARHAFPTIFSQRDFVEIGGPMSYGSDISHAWHQAGAYVGRILKGAKPADLPVIQASKFQLVINAQTARMLDLTIPPALLARADEVIE